MALHDVGAGPLEIDVHTFFEAQHAHEWGEAPTQPGGHVRRLRVLLVSALLRHVLWTHGQVPSPIAQLEHEVREVMEAEGLEGPTTCLAVETAPDPPPLPRGHMPWLRTAHVVRALALVTERLHALLCAVSLPELHVAIVLGPSLLFPQWTAMVRLEGSWDACTNGLDDTDECMGRRRKAAALLERKVTRALMEALPVSIGSAPTLMRVLVRVPAHVRVPGWRPRPHWTAPEPAAPDVSTPETTCPARAPATRPSRMSTRVQGLLQHRHATRPALALRTRRRAPVLGIMLQGAVEARERLDTRDMWQECDTEVRGLGRDGLL